MVRDPEFQDGVDRNRVGLASQIVGVEFGSDNTFLDALGEDLIFQDSPCALCEVQRSSVVMVPAKRTCPQGWTLEYEGLLMGDHKAAARRGEYVCVSLGFEPVEGGYAATRGGIWNNVEVVCGKSLPCPPYDDGFELSCVVCSK